MKKHWRNFITLFFLVLGIIATYIILKEYSIKEIIYRYTHVSAWALVAYLLVVAFLYITLTYRWDIILRSRKFKIPFGKLFVYRIIGTSINFLTPGPRVGGEPTQANLLAKHGVDFTEGLSTVMIDKIIDTTTCGILFIIGAFLIGVKYSVPKSTEITLLISGIAFIVVVVLFYYRMRTNRHFFLHIFRFLMLDRIKAKWLRKLESGIEKMELIMIDFYSNNKKAFIASVGISIFTWVIMFFEYYFATKLLGVNNVGVAEMFFIITFIGIAQLFPIPMAIGVLEAGQISAFALITLPAAPGVALAFLVRFKDIMISIIGLILLAVYGFHVKEVVEVVERKYRRKNGENHEINTEIK